MISNELLEILVCPETHQPLKLVDSQLLERLNEAVREGRIVNRGGRQVETPFQAGLVREDEQCFYPVIDDIPVMLIDEAISLEAIRGTS